MTLDSTVALACSAFGANQYSSDLVVARDLPRQLTSSVVVGTKQCQYAVVITIISSGHRVLGSWV